MTRPTDDNIRISLQELRNEASSWGDISQQASTAHLRIQDGADLSVVEMGIFAPGYGAFTSVREKLLSLAEGAEKEATALSETLADVAKVYESEEQTHVGQSESIHEQHGMW